ncbi:unnamed protein product [Absidia cylindrospora]
MYCCIKCWFWVNNYLSTFRFSWLLGSTRGGKSRHGRLRGKPGDKVQQKKKENEEFLKLLDEEKEKKPSWASILKGPTKLEPPASEPATSPIPNNNTVEKAIEPDDIDENLYHDKQPNITEEDSSSTNQQIAKGSESADIVEQLNNMAVSEEVTNDITDTNKDFILPAQTATEDADTNATTARTTTATTEQVGIQEPQLFVGFRKMTVRRLKQDEPVIFPGGGPGLENVNLQFGSLNLATGEEQPIKENEQDEQQQLHQNEEETTEAMSTNTPAITLPTDTPMVITTTTNTPHIQYITSSSASVNTNTHVSSGFNDPTTVSDVNVRHQAQQQESQQNVPSQPAPRSHQPQIPQYQQIFQPPQQHNTVSTTDAQVYPYAAYIPNSIPGNGHLPSFPNSAMGTLPDHYNHDGHNSISNGDPNVYNQSPSISNSQLYNRGKYSNIQEGMPSSPTSLGIMNNHISTSTAQLPQQPQNGMYSGNTGSYDSYYYIPNQYQGYQHIEYQPPPTLQQQQQPQQVPQQPQQQQQSKQLHSSYVNPNVYTMYGKQNHSVYQNYTNQQPYDDGMIHSSRTQGLTYDKHPYQPPSNPPQMQHYFDRNNLQLQQQTQHTEIVNGGQSNTVMMNDFDKHQGLSMPQPMITHGNYQLQYQQYHQQQQQPQQHQPQQTFHQQPSYNSNTPNNTINAYATWQNQSQQPLYWQQA